MISNRSNTFKCFCKQEVNVDDQDSFKKHILFCSEFQAKSPMTKFINGLKIDRLSHEELKILKCEMELKLEELRTYIEIRNENNGQMNFMPQDSGDSLQCGKCKKGIDLSNIIFLEACAHQFCKPCLVKQITENIKASQDCKCIQCNSFISEIEKKNLLGIENYNKLMDSVSFSGISTISCVKCKYALMFEPGKIEGTLKDETGQVLSQEKQLHYAQNRFKCPKCHEEQCRKCGESPYHLGKTCEEQKKFKESKLCKYCEEPIQKASAEMPDVCTNAECMVKLKDACTKQLLCGHSCSGFKGENNCLVCLHEQCQDQSKSRLVGQTGDDFCMICGIERLINAPCIQAKCGHVFHLQCITTRLQKRWHRPRVTFNFCKCPLCKEWLDFAPESPLSSLVGKYKMLFEDIKRKSLERLKYEKRDKDERLTTKGDPYYNKPVDYAIAIYSYYECFKCKKPYFGGLKRCEDLMQEEAKNDSFKPEELVCAECSDVGIALETCKTHGKEFIEFKCRFCCSVATWFCWGSTHFCDPCHKRQCSGDYVSKYSKDKLPKCGGKKICPLKVDHNGNGHEFALGCSLCRNLMNSHDF